MSRVTKIFTNVMHSCQQAERGRSLAEVLCHKELAIGKKWTAQDSWTSMYNNPIIRTAEEQHHGNTFFKVCVHSLSHAAHKGDTLGSELLHYMCTRPSWEHGLLIDHDAPDPVCIKLHQ